MKQRVAIALLTILLLGAGYGAGQWAARSRCKVPPPPASLLGELSSKTSKPAAAEKKDTSSLPDPAWLATQIEQIQPQIEEFRTKLDAIDRELDRKIDGILRPEQKAAWHSLVQGGRDVRAREQAESALTTKLSPEEVREIQLRPLYRLLGVVVVPIRVYWNTKQLSLDEAQKAQLTEFLKWRREQFIQLIDRSPPPSLELSTLAPMVKRLGEPYKQ